MKKTIKVSGSEGGFKVVVSRKKRKEDVLAEGIDNKRVAAEASSVRSWSSETGNTIESKSIDMEEECLVEETSVDYGKSGAFTEGDLNQMPKDLHVKTKKVLGKPLGMIDYGNVNTDNGILDNFFLLPSSLLIKPSVQVPVCKFFALDIDLVVIAGKSSQEKLSFIKKIFSSVNDFGGAFTPSKFGGVICVTFTSEKAIMAAEKLANNHGIVVNTNLKHPINNRTNRDIVIKEIPVGTLIEMVCTTVSEFGVVVLIKMQLVGLWQKAIVTLEDSNQADLLASKADVDKQTWDSKDEFKALLYTFLVETNTHDFWNFIGLMDGKICVIECNSVNYTWAHCTTVSVSIGRTCLLPCVPLTILLVIHLRIRAPFSAQDWFKLTKIYKKKSAPVSHPLAFGGKTWALVVGSIPSGTSLGYDSQLGSIGNSKPLLPVVNDLEKHLVSIESSLVSLTGQIGKLAKRLESFILANQGEDIVMGVGSDDATSDKTAAISGSTASPKVVKLENMLESLSASVISLSACLDGLALAGDDVIHWYKNMNNLVSIFMESKLKEKVCPWLTDKFDGVWVFTSGLDSSFMGAGVLIVMNSSLTKHICKVSEMPGWLLSIKLLFKNELSVSILGLYTGVSLVVRFSQAGEINSLIAKAVNEFSFVVLSGNFNEDGSQKCASFKKCLELGLVNFLIGSPAIKMPTWANSRGVMKTIDYVFVLLNLVNSLVYCSVSNVNKYFDTDHQAVSVSMGLSSLLDTCLFSLRKQANKDHWKFDVKNTSEAKWLEFKNAMTANTTMLSSAFDIICKIMVISAGGAFKKRWFKGFNIVRNKVLSRFHKLELLVSKLVKAFCLSFSVSFASLLVRFMFFSGAKFDDICSALLKARRLYHFSKLLESKHAEESHIRQAITNRMESFELDKGHTIRSVLECPFHKVVLDHLVMDNELVLKPDLVKSKGTTTQFPIFVVGLIIEDALEKNREFWLVWKAYDSVGWEHLERSLVRIKMCNFDLTDSYWVFDELDQGKSSVCGYRLNSYFVSGSGCTESQAGLSTFFAIGAFVDDTIWIGSSQAATQYILNQGQYSIFFFSSLPISVAHKGESHQYLGIFLSTEGLSRPSLTKTHSNIRFFTNLVLRKAVSDKQFLYLVSAVLYSIISYRMQFGYVSVSGLKLKAGLLMDFLSDTIHHPSFYDLKSFSQCQSESKVASVISFVNSGGILRCLFSYNVSNNFLAGMVHILLDFNLSLDSSLTSAFRFCDRFPMFVILGKSLFFKFLSSLRHFGIAFVDQLHNHYGIVFSWHTFKWWKRLDPHGLVPEWFNLSVVFLMASHSFSTVSVGTGLLNFCESDDFVAAYSHLSQVDIDSLFVYMDGSLKYLGTADCKAGAVIFFEDIDLVSSTLAELQAIVLALECMPAAYSVNLFSDSQAALDICRSELSLMCSDFCNQCWVERQHIQNVIHSKNLRISWHKIKNHSGVLGNNHANSIADAASLSGWYLPLRVNEHFLLVDGGVVSGNSKHFV
ncbi:hypothetical protein G9A89_017145 [Geosiphon pyriformis]|nr:hypothetical protein G9A89_017145 [Geosiphon pyriformis]